jgi:hypothetical protein
LYHFKPSDLRSDDSIFVFAAETTEDYRPRCGLVIAEPFTMRTCQFEILPVSGIVFLAILSGIPTRLAISLLRDPLVFPAMHDRGGDSRLARERPTGIWLIQTFFGYVSTRIYAQTNETK